MPKAPLVNRRNARLRSCQVVVPLPSLAILGTQMTQDTDYWDKVHLNRLSSTRYLTLTRSKTGSWLRMLARPYSDYLIWDVLFPRYLPKTAGLKLVELGSAPGFNLVRLNHRFGYIPYGIERSEHGVRLNQRVFLENGLPPENVIQADILSHSLRIRFVCWPDRTFR
jgi:hypothetical protein